mmetsp:Transcript_52302/g.156974  ORF Transcript_52302/g.156974 Transcript_52302/m.156974 type:complete len:1058 (-) Transcript_52302:418-3591(-)|eukprot:CAMPEP_0113561270 /NCGR_PEP_ID=MMETSP0015_2-20120614/19886_1 /TAXON_ID=2838 /ORGANISM="Odontella" /LENGTH=1057 /DNA_ID=CAMNT_0000463053 /DNA_START=430 /DNA_END=3603 /DNA_ORIENTATION=- /assembly_acc=CAM_ASM_000160
MSASVADIDVMLGAGPSRIERSRTLRLGPGPGSGSVKTFVVILLLASSSPATSSLPWLASCEAFAQPFTPSLSTFTGSATTLQYYPDTRREYRRRRWKKRTPWILDEEGEGEVGARTLAAPAPLSLSNNERTGTLQRDNAPRPRSAKARGRGRSRSRSRPRGKQKQGRFGRERLSNEERLRRAEDVESRLLMALGGMKSVLRHPSPWIDADLTPRAGSGSDLESQRSLAMTSHQQPLVFPSVRECNAALAAFGDDGELLRALRLFVKMRKAASLASRAARGAFDDGYDGKGESGYGRGRSGWPGPGHVFFYPPAPTLVTYSTLMSRAVHLGKAPVALRLWKLMKSQKEYFAKDTTVSASASSLTVTEARPRTGERTTYSPCPSSNGGAPIVPDVKALNILMNVYAKLSDPIAAQDLLEQMLDPAGGPDVPPVSLAGGSSAAQRPNVVTWNTLIDAYHLTGDLTSALDVLERMRQHGIQPDARTYTSLIATVARRRTARGGARDPDLAFALLDEMKDEGVRPNGVTYCALIDACGRCGRSDLALKGLRMMLRQKAEEEEEQRAKASVSTAGGGRSSNRRGGGSGGLENEVGAWTAAIDACARSGRVDTAMQLFRTMPKFGVKPNAITCGCLTDRLLKAGSVSRSSSSYSLSPTPSPCLSNEEQFTERASTRRALYKGEEYDGNGEPAPRIAETLEVLRYMKGEEIEPSEVMYTSLMSCAGRLAKMESRIGGGTLDGDDFSDEGASATEVYTELMRSLMRGGGDGASSSSSRSVSDTVTIRAVAKGGRGQGDSDDPHTLLLKVHLVFQEMTARGVSPDLACYNVLLRACGRAGDVDRVRSVLRRIISEARKGGDNAFDGPNDTTWREALRGAAMAGDGEAAKEFWDMAMEPYRANRGDGSNATAKENTGAEGSGTRNNWSPDSASFEALVEACVRDGDGRAFGGEKRTMYGRAVEAYCRYVRSSSDSSNNNQVTLDVAEEVRHDPQIMLLVLQAAVSVELMSESRRVAGNDANVVLFAPARQIAVELVTLECLREGRIPQTSLDIKAMKALELAWSWVT